jgi:hypothetical protein
MSLFNNLGRFQELVLSFNALLISDSDIFFYFFSDASTFCVTFSGEFIFS